MIYFSKDIAQYIVNKCIDDDKPISNLYLQEILFILDTKHRSEFNEPLVYDEFKKTTYGYYIPNVYYKYGSFGASPIFFKNNNYNCDIDSIDLCFINNIVENIRDLAPWDISQMVQECIIDKERGNCYEKC